MPASVAVRIGITIRHYHGRYLREGEQDDAGSGNRMVTDDGEVCFACNSRKPCDCDRRQLDLQRVAARLAAAGVTRARAGDLAGALSLLGASVRRDAGNARAWLAMGLCALGLGDVPTARRAWTEAAARDPGSLAPEWLPRLGLGGDLREAIECYNQSLDRAQRGAISEAQEKIARALALLPGLRPALELRRLLDERARSSAPAPLGGSPTPARARAHWRDRAFAGLAGMLLGMLVLQGIDSMRWTSPARELAPTTTLESPVAVQDVADGPTSSDSSTASLVMLVTQASVRDDDQFVGFIDSIAMKSTGPVGDSLRAVSAPRRPAAAVLRYARARAALTAHDTAAAWSHLQRALASRASTHVEDDALYDAARLAAARGDSALAGDIARQLLTTHARSMFANSTIRRLAQEESRSR